MARCQAAFVKESILNTIVIPLLKRASSVFLTISTLGSIFDAWKRMTDAKDERGRRVFLVKTYSTVCDDCIEKGMPDRCLHKQDMLPHWQSPEEEVRRLHCAGKIALTVAPPLGARMLGQGESLDGRISR